MNLKQLALAGVAYVGVHRKPGSANGRQVYFGRRGEVAPPALRVITRHLLEL